MVCLTMEKAYEKSISYAFPLVLRCPNLHNIFRSFSNHFQSTRAINYMFLEVLEDCGKTMKFDLQTAGYPEVLWDAG